MADQILIGMNLFVTIIYWVGKLFQFAVHRDKFSGIITFL